MVTSVRGRRLDILIADYVTLAQGADDDFKSISWSQLVRLWVFGDAHEVPMFQNVVVNFMHKKATTEWVVPTGEVNYVYSNTVSGAKLRPYVAALIGNTGTGKARMRPEDEADYCKEALCDLLRITWVKGFDISSKEEVAKWDLCQYHVHEAGGKCVVSGK